MRWWLVVLGHALLALDTAQSQTQFDLNPRLETQVTQPIHQANFGASSWVMNGLSFDSISDLFFIWHKVCCMFVCQVLKMD